ncbi:MAG TPA: cupin domain-containing protein [Gaiellaceae bacterium]|nr:cupin domain-containing protein [Gaiellaceae bacterium]
MGFDVIHAANIEWDERPGHEGQALRHAAGITDATQMTESRARMWRYPAHVRGTRHVDHGQEEVFVPITGTLTMLLGEPPERFDVEPGGLIVVHTGTAMQPRNESDEEIVFFAYGAPPVAGKAEYVDDVVDL